MLYISPLKQDLLQNCTNNTKVRPHWYTVLVHIQNEVKHVSCCLPCMSFCLWHVIHTMHTWHNPEPKLKYRIAVPDTPCHGRSECLDRHRFVFAPTLFFCSCTPGTIRLFWTQRGACMLCSASSVCTAPPAEIKTSDCGNRLWRCGNPDKAHGEEDPLDDLNVCFCKQSHSYTTCFFRLINANAISKRSATNKESQAVKRRLNVCNLFWCCLRDQVGGAFC